MPLTPADVHNASFSRPPIGKRGYNEAEVDRLLELVEDELIRHIEEKDELRRLNAAAIEKRQNPLEKLGSELDHWEGELRQREAPLQKKAAELRQRDAELRQHEATLQKKTAELRQHEATLQKKSSELRGRNEELRQHHGALQKKAVELRDREAEIRRQEAAQYEERAASHVHDGRFCQNGSAMRTLVDQQRTTVSEEQRITAVRTVTGPRAQRDTEWSAIRTVADLLGQELPESARAEWADQGASVSTVDEAAEVEHLQKQNAELNRINNILKAAAALFATQIQETEPSNGGRELTH